MWKPDHKFSGACAGLLTQTLSNLRTLYI